MSQLCFWRVHTLGEYIVIGLSLLEGIEVFIKGGKVHVNSNCLLEKISDFVILHKYMFKGFLSGYFSLF